MPEKDHNARWTKAEIATIGSIPLLTIVWAVIVGASGRDVNWTGVEWDFQRTALLGDSFGVIGAIMATAAAAFTFLTLRAERAEIERLRFRERERDRADHKRETEATYFQLLPLRNATLERIRYKDNIPPRDYIYGQRAIERIATLLGYKVTTNASDFQKSYNEFWTTVEGEVGHYLRFTYHIIRFAVSNFETEEERYDYVRLLRAQLSNAELELIAINSIYGAGKPRMKEFIERFSFLHPLPDERIEKWNLRPFFRESAFDSSLADGKSAKTLTNTR